MKIGFVGLGRMGKNMVLRLVKDKHKVVVWNRSPDKVREVVKKGAIGSKDIHDLVDQLPGQKIIWLMLPAGDVTEKFLQQAVKLLNKGDIIIDGGNSNFHDTIRRADMLKKKGIDFVDVGTSGGLAGATQGYCMMYGGSASVVKKLNPLFKSMCIKNGFDHMGPSGAGHYVKMIHNAIEYGMMQAMAEGFDLLENGRFKNLDLKKITHVWNHGSIVSSFLMECAEQAFNADKGLKSLKPHVDDSGEGRWAAIEAMEHKVPFTVNGYALNSRYISRDKNSMAFRSLAAIRNVFGGHAVQKKK